MTSSAPVTVVAKMAVQPGHEEAFLTELMKAVVVTREEDGCLAYDPHQGVDDPSVFVMVERWASPEALAAHSSSDHLRAFGSAVRSMMVARPEVTVTRAV